MKFFISILVGLSIQLSHAGGKEGGKAHTDWNQVFKQPEANFERSTTPAATELVEPRFLSQVNGSEVLLKWKPVEGVKYHLQVATDPNFKWLVVNEPLVDYTEYSLKNLQKKQQYFWRVFTQRPNNMATYTKSIAKSSSFETAE